MRTVPFGRLWARWELYCKHIAHNGGTYHQLRM